MATGRGIAPRYNSVPDAALLPAALHAQSGYENRNEIPSVMRSGEVSSLVAHCRRCGASLPCSGRNFLFPPILLSPVLPLVPIMMSLGGVALAGKGRTPPPLVGLGWGEGSGGKGLRPLPPAPSHKATGSYYLPVQLHPRPAIPIRR
jgi:hypothetical protein